MYLARIPTIKILCRGSPGTGAVHPLTLGLHLQFMGVMPCCQGFPLYTIAKGVRASPVVLGMWPCENVSHIQIQLFVFPALTIKLKLGLQIGGRLLIATNLDQSNYLLNHLILVNNASSRCGMWRHLVWAPFSRDGPNLEHHPTISSLHYFVIGFWFSEDLFFFCRLWCK
jgi:hypothetical protein